MQNHQRTMRVRLVLKSVILSMIVLSTGFSLLMAREAGKVEIVIRNSTFEFQGGALRPDQAGTLFLSNLDKIRHGFTSPLLEELEVRVESAGGIAYGKGIKGVYINPGETLQIHLTPNRAGSFSFRCDIHPDMKGELLLLSVEGV